MFSPEIYKQRREALRSLMGDGILLFMSNNEASMNYASNVYRYRQDSSFTYFYGHQMSGLYGVMDAQTGSDVLFGDDYTIDDIIWMGTQPTMAELGAASGVSETAGMEQFYAYVRDAVSAGKKIHYLPTYRDDQRLFLSALLGESVAVFKAGASLSLLGGVVGLRSVKSK